MSFAGIEITGASGKIYTDQTGHFPVTYSKGKKCVCDILL